MIKWVFHASFCHRSILNYLEPNSNDYYFLIYTLLLTENCDSSNNDSGELVNKNQINKTLITLA